MLRPFARLPLRTSSRHILGTVQRHERRGISFAPPSKKPRSWKGALVRWGLAGGAIYWYATSDMDLFNQNANEHGHVGPAVIELPDEVKLPTIETISAARRDRQLATLEASPSAAEGRSSPPPSPPSGSLGVEAVDGPEEGSPEALEEEASSQGAFNEETGEINWDCPCLGGMAHGPCGEQFRDAFSCFVHSKEEPKGVDCIDKFKTMQDCFREHPDIYGAELTDDDDEDENAPTPLDTPGSESASLQPATSTTTDPPAVPAATEAGVIALSGQESSPEPKGKPRRTRRSKQSAKEIPISPTETNEAVVSPVPGTPAGEKESS